MANEILRQFNPLAATSLVQQQNAVDAAAADAAIRQQADAAQAQQLGALRSAGSLERGFNTAVQQAQQGELLGALLKARVAQDPYAEKVLTDALQQTQTKAQASAENSVGGLRNAYENNNLLDYAAETIGGAPVNLLPQVAAGAAGKLLAGVPGALVAGAASGYGMNKGDVLNQMYADPTVRQQFESSPGEVLSSAGTAALQNTAVDVGPGLIASGALRGAKKALLGGPRSPITTTVAGTAAEAIPEAAQDANTAMTIEQMGGADFDPTSTQGMWQLGESAVGGALQGGGVAAAGAGGNAALATVPDAARQAIASGVNMAQPGVNKAKALAAQGMDALKTTPEATQGLASKTMEAINKTVQANPGLAATAGIIKNLAQAAKNDALFVADKFPALHALYNPDVLVETLEGIRQATEGKQTLVPQFGAERERAKAELLNFYLADKPEWNAKLGLTEKKKLSETLMQADIARQLAEQAGDVTTQQYMLQILTGESALDENAVSDIRNAVLELGANRIGELSKQMAKQGLGTAKDVAARGVTAAGDALNSWVTSAGGAVSKMNLQAGTEIESAMQAALRKAGLSVDEEGGGSETPVSPLDGINAVEPGAYAAGPRNAPHRAITLADQPLTTPQQLEDNRMRVSGKDYFQRYMPDDTTPVMELVRARRGEERHLNNLLRAKDQEAAKPEIEHTTNLINTLDDAIAKARTGDNSYMDKLNVDVQNIEPVQTGAGRGDSQTATMSNRELGDFMAGSGADEKGAVLKAFFTDGEGKSRPVNLSTQLMMSRTRVGNITTDREYKPAEKFMRVLTGLIAREDLTGLQLTGKNEAGEPVKIDVIRDGAMNADVPPDTILHTASNGKVLRWGDLALKSDAKKRAPKPAVEDVGPKRGTTLEKAKFVEKEANFLRRDVQARVKNYAADVEHAFGPENTAYTELARQYRQNIGTDVAGPFEAAFKRAKNGGAKSTAEAIDIAMQDPTQEKLRNAPASVRQQAVRMVLAKQLAKVSEKSFTKLRNDKAREEYVDKLAADLAGYGMRPYTTAPGERPVERAGQFRLEASLLALSQANRAAERDATRGTTNYDPRANVLAMRAIVRRELAEAFPYAEDRSDVITGTTETEMFNELDQARESDAAANIEAVQERIAAVKSAPMVDEPLLLELEKNLANKQQEFDAKFNEGGSYRAKVAADIGANPDPLVENRVDMQDTKETGVSKRLAELRAELLALDKVSEKFSTPAERKKFRGNSITARRQAAEAEIELLTRSDRETTPQTRYVEPKNPPGKGTTTPAERARARMKSAEGRQGVENAVAYFTERATQRDRNLWKGYQAEIKSLEGVENSTARIDELKKKSDALVNKYAKPAPDTAVRTAEPVARQVRTEQKREPSPNSPAGRRARMRALLAEQAARNAAKAEAGVSTEKKGGNNTSTVKKNEQSPDGIDGEFTTISEDRAALREKMFQEIYRIAGKEIDVKFNRLASQLGGSGEFRSEANKKRIIEVAIDAVNPMSVAHHEALHAVWHALGSTREVRQLKARIEAAASRPAVLSAVKRRLFDAGGMLSAEQRAGMSEAEIARANVQKIEQVMADPEERVAYLFQMWVADPEIRKLVNPETDTVFRKVLQFLRDLVGVLSESQQADRFFMALYNGKLSNPRTAPTAMRTIMGQSMRDKFESVAGPVADLYYKAVNTGLENMRRANVPALTELADMLYKEVNDQGAGTDFVEQRGRMMGRWNVAMGKTLEEFSKEELHEAMKNLQAMQPATSPAEKAVRELLDNFYRYMRDSGIEVRQVKDYFPRSWDASAIADRPDEFRQLLIDEGNMDLLAADNIVQNILHGSGQIDLAENEHHLGYTPFAASHEERQMKFITPKNAHKFVKFQHDDISYILENYIRAGVHRTEYARMFNDDGAVIKDLMDKAREQGATEREIEQAGKAVQAVEGTLQQHALTPLMRTATGAAMTLQNTAMLPLAVFSQFIDPLAIAARSGKLSDAGRAYLQALKDIRRVFSKSPDKYRELAEMVGAIQDDVAAQTMAGMAMSMGQVNRKINSVFFKVNGMQAFNNSMRVAATRAGLKYIKENLANPPALKELGLNAQDVKNMQFDEDGDPIVNSDSMSRAVYRFVESAVLHPNAAHQPTWMADPRFALLAHMKRFAYAFDKVLLQRGVNQLGKGNWRPMAYLMAGVPLMIATDMVKWSLFGGPSTANWGWADYMQHGLNRAGITGREGAFFGPQPGDGLMNVEFGPTLENLMRAGQGNWEQFATHTFLPAKVL